MTFVPFFFDGNRWHGIVDGQEKLAELVSAYRQQEGSLVTDVVLRCKMAPQSEINELPKEYHLGAGAVRTGKMPSFGYRREHTSEVTLESWAKNRGMNLREMIEKLPST